MVSGPLMVALLAVVVFCTTGLQLASGAHEEISCVPGAGYAYEYTPGAVDRKFEPLKPVFTILDKENKNKKWYNCTTHHDRPTDIQVPAGDVVFCEVAAARKKQVSPHHQEYARGGG